MLNEGGYIVLQNKKRVEATLLHDRPRSRIWVLTDGQYVKTVKDSHKVLQTPEADPDLSAWLLRSRRSWFYLTRHKHPGLLVVGDRVYDSYGDEGYLCQGLQVFDLFDHAHPARMSLRAFLLCAIQLSQAVGVMHSAGFVHGDITPGNVCFSQGLPVLIDYEMTVRIGQFVSLQPENSRYRAISCTPECCSPEQVYRQRVQPASDVYCIGLTLLSWLSERFGVGECYWNQTPEQSMALCARAEYPHWKIVESRVRFSNVLGILSKATQLVPCDRYTDGTALTEAFEELIETLSDDELDHPLNQKIQFPSGSFIDNHTLVFEFR